MGHSVTEIPRAIRRRLKRLAQKPSEHAEPVNDFETLAIAIY